MRGQAPQMTGWEARSHAVRILFARRPDNLRTPSEHTPDTVRAHSGHRQSTLRTPSGLYSHAVRKCGDSPRTPATGQTCWTMWREAGYAPGRTCSIHASCGTRAAGGFGDCPRIQASGYRRFGRFHRNIFSKTADCGDCPRIPLKKPVWASSRLARRVPLPRFEPHIDKAGKQYHKAKGE